MHEAWTGAPVRAPLVVLCYGRRLAHGLAYCQGVACGIMVFYALRTLPSDTMDISEARDLTNQAIHQIQDAVASLDDLEGLLTMIDQKNEEMLPAWSESYASELHAKALLLKLSNLAVAKFQYLHRHLQGHVGRRAGGRSDWSSTPATPVSYAARAVSSRKRNATVPIWNGVRD